MDPDGDQKNQISKREEKPNLHGERYCFNVGFILQSIWLRYNSIFPNITNGKFMESELRLVLYCGTFFWSLYLVYKTFI
jgi:hypothetical protein